MMILELDSVVLGYELNYSLFFIGVNGEKGANGSKGLVGDRGITGKKIIQEFVKLICKIF